MSTLGPVGYVIDPTSVVGCVNPVPTLTTLFYNKLKHNDYVLFEITGEADSLNETDSHNSIIGTEIHKIHAPSLQDIISKITPQSALNIELEKPSYEWCTAARFITKYVSETDDRSTDLGSVVKTILSAINQNADRSKLCNDISGISMRVVDYYVRYLNMLVDRARMFLDERGTLRRHEKMLLRSQLDFCLALLTGQMRNDVMYLHFTKEQVSLICLEWGRITFTLCLKPELIPKKEKFLKYSFVNSVYR